MASSPFSPFSVFIGVTDKEHTLGDKLEIHVACGSDLVTGDEVWEREKLESHMLV